MTCEGLEVYFLPQIWINQRGFAHAYAGISILICVSRTCESKGRRDRHGACAHQAAFFDLVHTQAARRCQATSRSNHDRLWIIKTGKWRLPASPQWEGRCSRSGLHKTPLASFHSWLMFISRCIRGPSWKIKMLSTQDGANQKQKGPIFEIVTLEASFQKKGFSIVCFYPSCHSLLLWHVLLTSWPSHPLWKRSFFIGSIKVRKGKFSKALNTFCKWLLCAAFLVFPGSLRPWPGKQHLSPSEV